MKSETVFSLWVYLLSINILIPWITAKTENDAGNLEKDCSDENTLISLVIEFILENRFDCPYQRAESILIIGTWHFRIPMWPGSMLESFGCLPIFWSALQVKTLLCCHLCSIFLFFILLLKTSCYVVLI